MQISQKKTYLLLLLATIICLAARVFYFWYCFEYQKKLVKVQCTITSEKLVLNPPSWWSSVLSRRYNRQYYTLCWNTEYQYDYGGKAFKSTRYSTLSDKQIWDKSTTLTYVTSGAGANQPLYDDWRRMPNHPHEIGGHSVCFISPSKPEFSVLVEEDGFTFIDAGTRDRLIIFLLIAICGCIFCFCRSWYLDI
jgi:hypothetical protein